MSRRDVELPVRHMLDHAREALAMAEERTRDDLDQDRQFELALTRLLEIVGEAANRVPEDVRARYPAVPWRQVVDFRNRLIHGYDSVDLDVVWSIVRTDLPDLVRALREPSDDEPRDSRPAPRGSAHD